MKLYEIDQAMYECLDAETGEIIDAEQLEALQMERDRKVENVAKWIKNMKSDVAALKAEEESFKRRRQAAENRVKSLTDYLEYALAGQPFESADKSVSIKTVRNGGKAPVVFNEDIEFLDPNGLPERFRKVSIEVDVAAVREALEAGEVLDFAHIGERGSHMVIK